MVRNAITILVALGILLVCRAAVAAPASYSFEARGVKIHYVMEGAGAPVVLIHGLHASAETNWVAPGVVGALAGNHLVVALDLPGHGASDKPDAASAYGLQMVEDVALLMDHLKIRRAHIVGYSLGGMVAVKFAALHPERVISLVDGGMGWFRQGSLLQKVWEDIPVREGARTPAVCIREIGQLATTEPEKKAIRAPVVVLVGDRDPVRKLYVGPLQTVRADWPVVEIAGAGHMNCIVKKQFSDEIVRWVAKNGSG